MDFIYLLMSCAVTAFIIVAIIIWNNIARRRFEMTRDRNNCQKICVYRQGSENCKNMPCQNCLLIRILAANVENTERSDKK